MIFIAPIHGWRFVNTTSNICSSFLFGEFRHAEEKKVQARHCVRFDNTSTLRALSPHKSGLPVTDEHSQGLRRGPSVEQQNPAWLPAGVGFVAVLIRVGEQAPGFQLYPPKDLAL